MLLQVFDSIAENGKATLEAVKGLSQVEELLEDGRAPADFVQELFVALAKGGDKVSLDGFKRFLAALEADLAHTDIGIQVRTCLSVRSPPFPLFCRTDLSHCLLLLSTAHCFR